MQGGSGGMDDFGLFGAIKGLIILLAIIAVPVVIIALGIQYWPITIIIVGGAIAGVVYLKRQKRAKNTV